MSPTATAERAPSEAFHLREALDLAEGSVSLRSDGSVGLHILRPCIGKGMGSHLYEADMLRENAHKFAGWRMYLDHQSETARKAAAGLPRSVRDLAGRVMESKWDGSIPADPQRGYGKGAVVAKVRPVGLARQLIEEDPELMEASINARATSVRPITRDGKQVWLVEGIEDQGSVDFVTEGGAGGRVASLLEAAYHDQRDEEMAVLESLTDQELLEEVRTKRPGLANRLQRDNTNGPDASGRGEETHVGENPAQVLREALQTDEGREVLDEHVNKRIEEAVQKEREALRDETEMIRAEARADADRRISLRDLRDEAHRLIREAKLPPGFESDLVETFGLDERGRPNPRLNVYDEVEDGRVVRSAREVLVESVEKAIERSRERIREAAEPTRVTGQGPDGGEEGEKPSSGGDSLWRKQLQEAGFDPDAAYDDTPPPAEEPVAAAAGNEAERS